MKIIQRLSNQKLVQNQKMSKQPIRQKSMKNIFHHIQTNQNKLKIQELVTQPSIKNFDISIRKLIQKHNPQHTRNIQYAYKIKDMQMKYYDAGLILLQNSIAFFQSQQCIKRFYFQQEFKGKIQWLGEYYKYHQDQPRIFLSEVKSIVANYQQQRRELQYNRVRQKMNLQMEANQQNKKNNFQQQNVKSHQSKHMNQKKNDFKKSKKSQKILKNIQLSYIDFQNKPVKTINLQHKQKQIKRKLSSNCIQKQKGMKKSNSSNCKHVFSHNFQHMKSKQHSKNDKKLFSIKNAESKQIKNLQNKYTQIISQLFRKKRSNSKNIMIEQKIQSKVGKIHKDKTKQSQVDTNLYNQEPNHNSVASKKENKEIQYIQKKIVRSKSQTNMNICKSNKLLTTLKTKIQQKAINLNTKPTNTKFQSKQNSKLKYESNTNQQTLKRQKYSSSKSLRQHNLNGIQRQVKTVKIFEITKKDLILDPSSKNSSVQKQIVSNHQNQRAENKIKVSRKQNKQNQNNEIIVSKDKKRTISSKNIAGLSSVSKKKQVKNPQKEQATITMFGRVLKSKIRG